MTPIFRRLIIAACALPMIVPTPVGAQAFQNNDDIDAQVAASLASGGLNAMPVDRRLKLAACPQPLRIEPPLRQTVAIHCDVLKWRIYTHVDGRGTRVATMPVIIKRGDPVTVDFVAPGFAVTTSGIAQSDARAGDRVSVRVEQKSAPVIGEAIDMGSVRVGGLN